MSKVVVQIFCKKGILKIIAKFTRKLPALEFLFNMRLQRLQHRCFSVNFEKFQEHLFYRTSHRTVASETLHINLLKIILSNLRGNGSI